MVYEPVKLDTNYRAIESFDWRQMKKAFSQLRRSPRSYSYYEQPHMTVIAINGKAFSFICQLDLLNVIRSRAFAKDRYWAHSSVNMYGEGGMGCVYTPRMTRPKFGDLS